MLQRLVIHPVCNARRTRGAAPNATPSAVAATNTPTAAGTDAEDPPCTSRTFDHGITAAVTRSPPISTTAAAANAAEALEMARRTAPKSSRPVAAATSLSRPLPNPRSANPSRPDAVINSSHTPKPSGGNAPATAWVPSRSMATVRVLGPTALTTVTRARR